MKPSTLMAKAQLDRALQEVNNAWASLKLSREQPSGWLAERSIAKTQEAEEAVKIALGHVSELCESEGAYDPERDEMTRIMQKGRAGE